MHVATYIDGFLVFFLFLFVFHPVRSRETIVLLFAWIVITKCYSLLGLLSSEEPWCSNLTCIVFL